MLFTTLHIPGTYLQLGSHVPPPSYNYRDLLTILEHAVENCILLDDEKGCISKSIGEAIGKWPYKEQLIADEYWAQLMARRLVHVPACKKTTCSCGFKDCMSAVERAACPGIDMVVVPGGCPDCSALGAIAVDPTSYPFSPFYRARKKQRRIELNDREWSKNQFETRIWEPLFRHASVVKIYDRYIGRTVQFPRQQACRLAPNFRRGLDWIVEQYLRFGQTQMKVLEIYCGLDPNKNLSNDKVYRAKRTLESWAQEKQAEMKFPIAITLLREKKRGVQMNHARVLITNQTAVNIERGFDILHPDGSVRDVMISQIEHPEKYQRHIGEMEIVN